MGVSDESKFAKPHLPRLPHGHSESHGHSQSHDPPVSPNTDVGTGTDSSRQDGWGISIIHLPPGSDGLADCITVNHTLHSIDDSVGVAAFHNEKSYGIITVKVLKKNYKESRKFLGFLGFDLPSHQKSDSVNVNLGDHGVCWYDPERYQRGHYGGPYDGPLTLFRKVTFSYSGQLVAPELDTTDATKVPLQSEQFIHFRCGALGANHRFSDYAASPITIVSGVCLFSAAILDDVRNLGNDHMQNHEQAVRDIVEHPTLHATEAMRRLSQNIADMIFGLQQTMANMVEAGSKKKTSGPPIRVKLDVARLAYYDLAQEMLSAQKWDFSSGKIWLDIVDRRHDTLFDEFSSMIVDALQCRGLNPNTVEIYASSGSRQAEQTFKSRINEERTPDIDLVLEELSNDKSNVWSEFLDLAQVSQEQRKELTIKDLARLTYPYELIEPMLNHDSSSRRRLAIMVDCPFEWRIFNAATKALDRYNRTHQDAKHLLIGTFPFPRILSTPCKNLFYYNCRREYRVRAGKQADVKSEGAISHGKMYLNTNELADLSSRLPKMPSSPTVVTNPA